MPFLTTDCKDATRLATYFVDPERQTSDKSSAPLNTLAYTEALESDVFSLQTGLSDLDSIATRPFQSTQSRQGASSNHESTRGSNELGACYEDKVHNAIREGIERQAEMQRKIRILEKGLQDRDERCLLLQEQLRELEKRAEHAEEGERAMSRRVDLFGALVAQSPNVLGPKPRLGWITAPTTPTIEQVSFSQPNVSQRCRSIPASELGYSSDASGTDLGQEARAVLILPEESAYWHQGLGADESDQQSAIQQCVGGTDEALFASASDTQSLSTFRTNSANLDLEDARTQGGSSRPTSLLSNSSFSSSFSASWGLPASLGRALTDPAGVAEISAKRACHQPKRMRRFPSTSNGLKPLILSSTLLCRDSSSFHSRPESILPLVSDPSLEEFAFPDARETVQSEGLAVDEAERSKALWKLEGRQFDDRDVIASRDTHSEKISRDFADHVSTLSTSEETWEIPGSNAHVQPTPLEHCTGKEELMHPLQKLTDNDSSACRGRDSANVAQWQVLSMHSRATPTALLPTAVPDRTESEASRSSNQNETRQQYAHGGHCTCIVPIDLRENLAAPCTREWFAEKDGSRQAHSNTGEDYESSYRWLQRSAVSTLQWPLGFPWSLASGNSLSIDAFLINYKRLLRSISKVTRCEKPFYPFSLGGIGWWLFGLSFWRVKRRKESIAFEETSQLPSPATLIDKTSENQGEGILSDSKLCMTAHNCIEQPVSLQLDTNTAHLQQQTVRFHSVSPFNPTCNSSLTVSHNMSWVKRRFNDLCIRLAELVKRTQTRSEMMIDCLFGDPEVQCKNCVEPQLRSKTRAWAKISLALVLAFGIALIKGSSALMLWSEGPSWTAPNFLDNQTSSKSTTLLN